MDDKFIDPSIIPSPNLNKDSFTMNTYDGTSPDEVIRSPAGDIQQDPSCNRPLNANSSITNVLARKLNSTVLQPNPLQFQPAEAGAFSETSAWQPSMEGTAMEEDLMNGVHSVYSSLMPKGDGLAVYRPDATDSAPSALPPAALQAAQFKPKDGDFKIIQDTPIQNVLIPEPAPYSTSDMENGTPASGPIASGDCTQSGGPDVFTPVTQQSAMINSQYQSVKMDTPKIENIYAVSGDNKHDMTGLEQPEGELPGKKDTTIIEGTAVKDVSLTTAQEVVGTTAGVVLPGLKSLATPTPTPLFVPSTK